MGMRNSTVFNCNIVELNKIQNRAGNISVIESEKSVPFPIKRVYYLYDVPSDEERGGHARDCASATGAVPASGWRLPPAR